MSELPPASPTSPADPECLKSWARRPVARSLRPVVERYLAFVHSVAHRRAGDPAQAPEITQAVFAVLARRARRLSKKTVLAGWLFAVTALACRKASPKRATRTRWFRRAPRNALPPDAPPWTQLAPEIDAALDRLPARQRHAVLVRVFLGSDWETVAATLRISERRAQKRVAGGLKQLAKHLARRGVKTDSASLESACGAEASALPLPQGLDESILMSLAEQAEKKPSSSLARRILSTLAWRRWRRRILIGAPSLALFLALVGSIAWYIDSLSGHSRLIVAFWLWSVRHEAKNVPGLAEPARPWPSTADTKSRSIHATTIRQAQDLYRTTNIWLAHLKFSNKEWEAMQPTRIGVLPNFLQPDGTALLRNPKAKRSGLAGVVGLDFEWARANFEFGGLPFTNVAARFKGNGTYLTSLSGMKQAFKLDLNKLVKGQKLGAIDELNFHNLVDDRSYMSDALGYEFFRDAGVPAPRTAYAYLSLSVDGQWERKPLGLYAMVEPVDEVFVAERFGSKRTPVFKPVTYQLFEHLGDDWSAYSAIYDLKTKATVEQLQRVIDLSRLVSQADDAEFAARLGDFLDLDEFGRFLAGEVLLSSYDSFLANGQNFYLYLHPVSDKFGFIPWDLDLAWGDFFLLGSTKQRERASISHPWVGNHRFLERVMAVEEFQRLYRKHLDDFLTRLLVPNRLDRRIDEIAAAIRSAVAAESQFRLAKFKIAISDTKTEQPKGGRPYGADRPVHQLKEFIRNRARSVREQLDGKSTGVILERTPNK